MTEEKKEIRIAAKLPVAIVEKIDEAIAAGLAKTRSGFIRDVVARSFDAQRSDRVCAEQWNILILSHLETARYILDIARQPGGFNYAYGVLDGTRQTIEFQVRVAEAEAQRASTNAWLSKWRLFPREEEGAANGAKKGKKKTETEATNDRQK